MYDLKDRPNVATVPTPYALRGLLLHGNGLSAEDQHLASILSFFGIPWENVSADEIVRRSTLTSERSGFCILTSAASMAEALRGFDAPHGALPSWLAKAESVYIYGFEDNEPCKRLLRLLANDAHARVGRLNTHRATLSVSEVLLDLCGPMSGMKVSAELYDDSVLRFSPGTDFESVIAANDGDLFCKIRVAGVPFFLNACHRIVDINLPSDTYFDVRKQFCESVPVTAYLTWAFREVSWRTPETSGCLVVDDSALRSRYGFLKYREALELMDLHNFTTTIAYIPIDWRGTQAPTVSLFQEHPDRFSLCVHGCDHTKNEFTSSSSALLNKTIKTATRRMEMLNQRTQLPWDRIMVFPKGKFSSATGRVLKLNGFVAAVNTQVAPINADENDTTISDLWNVAIMKYGTFPIFTRRYPNHGIENFAFDALLGKPCIIAGHHDAFQGHGRNLTDFIAKLNSLNWNLHWRTLGDTVNHSYKVRKECDGTSVIQMFAENLVLENRSGQPGEVVFMQEEAEPKCVKALMVNQTPQKFDHDGKFLRFRISLLAGQPAEVHIAHFDMLDEGSKGRRTRTRVKAHLRRYMCMFRDDYLSQIEFVSKAANRVISLWK